MTVRPVLFMTYTQKDQRSDVVDISKTLEAARLEAQWAKRGGFVYRVERLPNGTYGNDRFIEELK